MFRPTKIKHYLRYMERLGFDAKRALADTRIQYDMLDDPAYLIDTSQSQRVVSNMISLTGNDELGFDIGLDANFDDFGIAGYALMCCRHLKDVFDTWAAFGPTLVGSHLTLQLEERGGGRWRVTFNESVPLGPLLRFCAEETLSAGDWLSCTVIRDDIHYESVEFAYPTPDNIERYERVFNAPVIFDAPVTAVNVASPSLYQPCPDHRDTEFFNLCQSYCHEVMREITEGRPLSFKVRQIFLNSAGNLPNLETTAELLHMSSRTLKRKLQQEGVNFNELLSEFRCDLVKKYIESNKSLPLEKVALLTGYSDAKSLSRAFKNWTGQTVSDYRRTH